LLKENAVILFTRIPIPGKTKTRLQALLTGEECASLQRAFICDIFKVLQAAGSGCDVFVCYTPEGDPARLIALLPGAHSFFPQSGESLGDKMHNAISHVLSKGYERCLLIGSDVPLLKSKTIDDAFHLLEENDVVLCPTVDGGYYLIGMEEPCEELFRLEEYGVPSVFEKTLAATVKAGISCAIGDQAMDIDEPEGLLRLMEILKQESPDVCVETRKALCGLRTASG